MNACMFPALVLAALNIWTGAAQPRTTAILPVPGEKACRLPLPPYQAFCWFSADRGRWPGDYSMTQYGDSIYQSMPNENIIGMWVAMTSLHVGDSVTLVIPAGSAYGSASRSPIEPFSTLIYHMKMKGVPKYEK